MKTVAAIEVEHFESQNSNLDSREVDAVVQENFVAVDESVNLVAVAVDSVNLAAVKRKCDEVDWESLEVAVAKRRRNLNDLDLGCS